MNIMCRFQLIKWNIGPTFWYKAINMVYCKIFNESLSQYLWINCVTAFAFECQYKLGFNLLLNSKYKCILCYIHSHLNMSIFYFMAQFFFFSFLKWWSAVCTRLFVNLTWRHISTSLVTTDVPPTSSTLSTTSKPRGKYYWGGGSITGEWRAFRFLTVQGPPHFWDKWHIHAQTSIITDRCQGPLRWNASSKSHGSFKIFISEIFVYF